jgi:hypothetical protein
LLLGIASWVIYLTFFQAGLLLSFIYLSFKKYSRTKILIGM